MAFSPAEMSLLASASDDDTCKVWRMGASGATQAASFHGHQDSVLRVSWSPAGDMLASGEHDPVFLSAASILQPFAAPSAPARMLIAHALEIPKLYRPPAKAYKCSVQTGVPRSCRVSAMLRGKDMPVQHLQIQQCASGASATLTMAGRVLGPRSFCA